MEQFAFQQFSVWPLADGRQDSGHITSLSCYSGMPKPGSTCGANGNMAGTTLAGTTLAETETGPKSHFRGSFGSIAKAVVKIWLVSNRQRTSAEYSRNWLQETLSLITSASFCANDKHFSLLITSITAIQVDSALYHQCSAFVLSYNKKWQWWT